LYTLTRATFHGSASLKISFIAGCLHIISPAGLFLSAPYAESSFAFLNFSGLLLLQRGFGVSRQSDTTEDLCTVAAGIVFGLTSTFRSNGLLNGLLFLEEAVRVALRLRHGVQLSSIRRLAAVGLGGVCVGVGFLTPQYLAYQDFCGAMMATSGMPPRPWCGRALPSIYTFVQDYYWNNGFLRYWVIPNIPLFLLAAPMLAIMVLSSLWAFRTDSSIESVTPQTPSTSFTNASNEAGPVSPIVRSLAASQLLLAILALTRHHVQIITRISSGYPVLYFWLAAQIEETKTVANGRYSLADLASRYMVVYALVQGGLFASFLPPA